MMLTQTTMNVFYIDNFTFSPAPTVVSASVNSAQAAASAQSSVNVDSSHPTTSLQIRLSDGTR